MISLAALSLLLSVSLLGASPHDRKGAKITKNEAQHIALKRYPGARVTATKLETVRGILFWSIEIACADGKSSAVTVDAKTGRVASGKKATR